MTELAVSSLQDYTNLLKENLFFNSLFNNLFEGLFIIDKEHKVVYWNKTAEIIAGYSNESIINEKISGKILQHMDKNGTTVKLNEYPVIKCLNTGKVVNQKAIIAHKKGFPVPVLVSVIPLKDDNGSIIGAAEIFMDDTAHEDLEKAHDKIRESSIMDTLTNLYNRSEIINRIEIEMEKAERYEMPLCLCICDIDNFKNINEKWGNHAGDIVLRTISDVLKTNLRRTDLVGRYSTKEFIILLPLIDMTRALRAIEKIQIKLSESPISVLDNSIITMSFGLTEIITNDTLEDFVDRAESAIYKAKKLGKNRVEIFK
jgi:diguanylate cyclase (GGDEF)-like protein/PAS domain S-box-containing protein